LELSFSYLPTYLPTFLSTYSSTSLPACLYMGNTIVSLCLPFPCRNASHSDSSTDLLLTVFLTATSILPTSFFPWLSLYLSLWLYPLYSPTFRSRSPASRSIHRYQQNSFFYEASNMWTTVNLPGAAITKGLTGMQTNINQRNAQINSG